MRIGVLGGTFDPPHKGHLQLALAAANQLELDEVILMPAFRNPIKDRRVSTPAKDRLAMVEALVRSSDDPRLAYSDLEITRQGPSYTVDTMTELQMARPAEYWFIMGADSLKTLPDWKQPQRLVRLCRLAVAVRLPMTELDVMNRVPAEFKEHVDLVNMDPVNISSTEIRERIQRRQGVNAWVPDEVLKTIATQRLYT